MVKHAEPSGRLPKGTRLHVLIEKEGRLYVGHCLELGIASQGRTRKECLAMVKEAVELWLDTVTKEQMAQRLKQMAGEFCELSIT